MTTKIDDEIVELRTDEVEIVSGASPGHVVAGVGLLIAVYFTYQEIQRRQQQ